MSRDASEPMQPELLSRQQTSEITNLSVGKLDLMRRQRSPNSPPFFRIGSRVLYPLAGIRSWAEARLAAGSEFCS